MQPSQDEENNSYTHREREIARLLTDDEMHRYRTLDTDHQLYVAYFVLNGDTFETALHYAYRYLKL